MNLDKFEVRLSVDTKPTSNYQDITDIVKSISIKESIHGDLSGSMYCLDGAGVLDSLIGTNNAVVIKYTYYNKLISNSFYLDGVKDVRFDTGFKEYNIKLGSLNSLINANLSISKVYNGLSSDILSQLHSDVYGKNTSLKVLSPSKTSGKYIAPNINPKTIERLILLNSYGENESPMFLFQKLVDGGITTLECADNMEKKDNFWVITTKADEKLASESKLAPLGIAKSIRVDKQYHSNIKATNDGLYGKTLNTYDIENTTFKEVRVGETPLAMTTNRTYRKNLYEEGDEPLLNNFEINTDNTKEIGLLNNVELTMLRRVHLFAIKIRAIGMSAVPMLSVGNCVYVDIQETKEGANHIHKGKYLVAGITHSISLSEKFYFYTQDLELVRR